MPQTADRWTADMVRALPEDGNRYEVIDVFVAPFDAQGRRGQDWTDIKGLALAIEVLSPSTARANRQGKRRLYQRHDVGEYWIVDLDARVIERWKPRTPAPRSWGSVSSGRLAPPLRPSSSI